MVHRTWIEQRLAQFTEYLENDHWTQQRENQFRFLKQLYCSNQYQQKTSHEINHQLICYLKKKRAGINGEHR